MATHDDVAFLKDALAPLCLPLHESLEKAAEIALAHFTEWDMTGREDGRERTDLTRAHCRRILRSKIEETGGWEITSSTRNGQLLVRRGLLRIKVLHVAPENAVPAPGTNRSRVRYWCNPPKELHGVSASRLLGLWAVDSDSGDVSVRIVRPTGAWMYRQQHVADIDFTMPRDGDDLLDMEFRPDDREFRLPLDFGDGETNDDIANGW